MMESRYTFASGTNADFIDSLYQQYKQDPSQLDGSWRQFFDGYEFALKSQAEGRVDSGGEGGHEAAKVEALINAYRRLGHLSAHLDPLRPKPSVASDMLPEHHGLADVASEATFCPAYFGDGALTFSDILKKLQATYCGRIGPDYREINDIEAVIWLQERMEVCSNQPDLGDDLRKRIYYKLAQAENFEKFLQARYLGQKRFSLEGLESLVPLLDVLMDQSASDGVEELCIGMAHRGRLNVLANVMEKPYEHMLHEFEGSEFNPFDIDGDVKYHLGFANAVKTHSGHSLRMFLCSNPSHLEAVNPVLEGFVRSRQETLAGKKGDLKESFGRVVPVLLHGDAAFIGQGLVAETLNLSQLASYTTGGTIHIITNNQIGFTTDSQDSRSCHYASDIAKVIRAPVLHVNADDPEAVAWVAQLASQFRHRFERDIVIDLIGYRRHGHNETDEPAFTQPLTYKVISKHQTVLTQYREKLISQNGVDEKELDSVGKKIKDQLQKSYEQVHGSKVKPKPVVYPKVFDRIFAFSKVGRSEVLAPAKTNITGKAMKKLIDGLTSFPKDFTPHAKIKKLLANRKKMAEGAGAVDWGCAELLAFAALADEGHAVRLSGQDCKRGTFSSRHGVWFDVNSGQPYEPLKKIGDVEIINSPLSEQGCVGFEYGYSIAKPEALVLWEAQFGDFANGAQIIVDQFIVASEAKWQMPSGLVLMLPHGYEGMGPEHSSARPERFLQSCGNLNIQVCNVTTAAQLFHVLRRQVYRKFRKPLVIFTPKSLLRHPKVVSPISDFTDKVFSEIVVDDGGCRVDQVDRIILCTGKIYYELSEKSGAEGISKLPVIRLEQLYPFPYERLKEALARYPKLKCVTWVQEEPANMGAWTFVRHRLQEVVKASSIDVQYVGRKNSGTTAEGSLKAHQIEQKRIIDEAYAVACGWAPAAAAQG